MGALIPSPNDLELIDALNTSFSGNKLKTLRKHIKDKNDDFFEPTRKLRRIAWRLKIFPVSGGNRPKGRWLKFLKDILTSSVHDKILAELRSAVGVPGAINDKCVGVRFWAVYESALGTPYDVEIYDDPDPNGLFWKTIILKCKTEIDANEPGDASDPPKDNGEQTPPQPSLLTTRRQRRQPASGRSSKKVVTRRGKAKKGKKTRKR
ncbi:hypothetical protein [Bradyrhizobium guangxiense]|uniref:hypothetical protein n=1 Tax=Bradyrhizobium guangxiense TaxID=1325115 RepID=UPI0010091EF3|nr:hypothetical protein [Bradyrhizobium guangxiense]